MSCTTSSIDYRGDRLIAPLVAGMKFFLYTINKAEDNHAAKNKNQFNSAINRGNIERRSITLYYNYGPQISTNSSAANFNSSSRLCWVHNSGENYQTKLNETPEQTIYFSDIDELYLGKNSILFRPFVDDLLSSHCCVIRANNFSTNLHLEADQGDARNILSSALSTIAQISTNQERGQQVIEPISTSTVPAEFLSLQRGFPFNLYSRNKSSEAVRSENIWLSYQESPLSPNDLAAGSLFYIETSENKEPYNLAIAEPRQKQSIEVRKIVDIFLGKTTLAFKSNNCRALDEKYCITLQTSAPTVREWNLFSVVPGNFVQFVVALKYLLLEAGQNNIHIETPVSRSNSSNDSHSQSIYTIKDNSGIKTNINNNSSSGSDHLTMIKQDTEESTERAKQGLLKMKAGGFVTAYAPLFSALTPLTPRKDLLKQQFFMFYSEKAVKSSINQQGEADLGAIYYTAASNLSSSASLPHFSQCRSFPLASLSDIFVGKHTSALQSSLAAAANKQNCFSLASEEQGTQLDIEADSLETVMNWVLGIKLLLKQQEDSEIQISPVNSKSNSANFAPPAASNSPLSESRPRMGRRMSNLPDIAEFADLSSTLDSIPPLSESNPGSLTAVSSETFKSNVENLATSNKNVALLQRGLICHHFEDYLLPKQRLIYLFYMLNDETALGSLYWNEITHNLDEISAINTESPAELEVLLKKQPFLHYPSVKYRIPLHSVHSIYLGKQSRLFQQSQSFANINNKLFCSILGGCDILNLKCKSIHTRDSIVEGIRFLLQQANSEIRVEQADKLGEKMWFSIHNSYVLSRRNSSNSLSSTTTSLGRTVEPPLSATSTPPTSEEQFIYDGLEFIHVESNPGNPPIQTPVFLCVQCSSISSSAFIAWTTPENRNTLKKLLKQDEMEAILERAGLRVFSLNSIAEVFFGKMKDILQHPSLEIYPNEACFSIIRASASSQDNSPLELHLIANPAHNALQFLTALQKIITLSAELAARPHEQAPQPKKTHLTQKKSVDAEANAPTVPPKLKSPKLTGQAEPSAGLLTQEATELAHRVAKEAAAAARNRLLRERSLSATPLTFSQPALLKEENGAPSKEQIKAEKKVQRAAGKKIKKQRDADANISKLKQIIAEQKEAIINFFKSAKKAATKAKATKKIHLQQNTEDHQPAEQKLSSARESGGKSAAGNAVESKIEAAKVEESKESDAAEKSLETAQEEQVNSEEFLAGGSWFNGFFALNLLNDNIHNDGLVFKRRVHVFYCVETQVFYWNETEKHLKNPYRSLKLTEIKQLHYGKSHSFFQQDKKVISEAKEANSLSILGKATQLHLESEESETFVRKWLQCVAGLLTAAQLMKLEVAEELDQSIQPVAQLEAQFNAAAAAEEEEQAKTPLRTLTIEPFQAPNAAFANDLPPSSPHSPRELESIVDVPEADIIQPVRVSSPERVAQEAAGKAAQLADQRAEKEAERAVAHEHARDAAEQQRLAEAKQAAVEKVRKEEAERIKAEGIRVAEERRIAEEEAERERAEAERKLAEEARMADESRVAEEARSAEELYMAKAVDEAVLMEEETRFTEEKALAAEQAKEEEHLRAAEAERNLHREAEEKAEEKADAERLVAIEAARVAEMQLLGVEKTIAQEKLQRAEPERLRSEALSETEEQQRVEPNEAEEAAKDKKAVGGKVCSLAGKLALTFNPAMLQGGRPKAKADTAVAGKVESADRKALDHAQFDHAVSKRPSLKQGRNRSLRNALTPTFIAPNHSLPSAEAAVSVPSPFNDPLIQQLIEGHAFTLYEKCTESDKERIQSSIIFLYYDHSKSKNNPDALGNFVWNKGGNKAAHQPNALPLHKITECFYGKQTAIFQHVDCTSLDNGQAFAFCSYDSSLNLYAESNQLVLDWLNGLNCLLNLAKAVESSKPTSSDSVNLPDDPLIQALIQGYGCSLYTSDSKVHWKELFSTDSTAKISNTAVSLAYSHSSAAKHADQLGHLTIQSADKSLDKSIPLDSISECFYGPQTPLFKTNQCQSLAAARCFSICTAEEAFNLFSNHDSDVLDCLNGLAALMKLANRSETSEKVAVQAPLPAAFNDPLIQQLLKGASFTRYQRINKLTQQAVHWKAMDTGSAVDSTKIYLYYDHSSSKSNPNALGNFVWNEGEVKSNDSTASNQLPLHLIAECFYGKQTEIFKREECSSVLTDQAFSICSAESSLDLSAASNELVLAWLNGLSALMNFSSS
jgi:hypothetical protein